MRRAIPDGDCQKASFMTVDSVRPGTRALQTTGRPDRNGVGKALVLVVLSRTTRGELRADALREYRDVVAPYEEVAAAKTAGLITVASGWDRKYFSLTEKGWAAAGKKKLTPLQRLGRALRGLTRSL
jgi:hypothetical protein